MTIYLTVFFSSLEANETQCKAEANTKLSPPSKALVALTLFSDVRAWRKQREKTLRFRNYTVPTVTRAPATFASRRQKEVRLMQKTSPRKSPSGRFGGVFAGALAEANQQSRKKAAGDTADATAAIRGKHAVITMRPVCPNSFRKAETTDKFAGGRTSWRRRSAVQPPRPECNSDDEGRDEGLNCRKDDPVWCLSLIPFIFHNRK